MRSDYEKRRIKMNKKKVLLLLCFLELFITVIITILFINGTIPLKIFAALLFIVSSIFAAAVFLTIRKMNP